MKIKEITDLVKLGHQVLYFKDEKLYYVVSSFTPIDHSAHIYTNQLTGKDITTAMDNLDTSFRDIHTINTTINNIEPITIRFPEGIKWIWFTA